MTPEAHICQNCKQSFIIAPEDFAFYEKIKVPPPTFCPQCRLQRRHAWRNMRSIYKRRCDLCGQEKIGIYASDNIHRAYCPSCWWGDGWDALDYGRAYDFSRSFFEQFSDLLRDVPLISRSVYEDTMVNSDYTNMASALKECYLVFLSATCEKSSYCQSVDDGKECIDVSWSSQVELCYEGINLHNCYQLFYSKDCLSCSHSYFLNDCANCTNCFGCSNLRNKQYYIFNKAYSQEGYENKLAELGMYSERHDDVRSLKKTCEEFWSCYPRKYIHGSKNQDVSGDYLYNAKNTKNSFFVNNIEDSKYCSFLMFTNPVRESYDWTQYGDNGELVYEMAQSGAGVYNNHFGWGIWRGSQNVEYSALVSNCSDCFGCVGLQKKKYCIFNKQYIQEEYETLVAQIKKQMNDIPYTDHAGLAYRYGEFFPIEISPFAYNESVAQEEFPLNEQAAKEKGYAWRQENASVAYRITKRADALSDAEWSADELVKEIVGCVQCGKGYRFIKMELAFYREHHIPLPRLCSNCRYIERLKKRGRTVLSKRFCDCLGATSKGGAYQNIVTHLHGDEKCMNEFETAYTADRSEIVYCEECYQKEIN